MLRTLATLRRLPLAFTTAGTLAACGSDSSTGTTQIAGNYSATTFLVTPTGQPTINVLPQGGTLSIAIASNNSTSGTLSLPASVTGDAPFTASMAGTAVRTGNTVKFQQSADTFVRDLTWTVNGNALQVSDQTAGSASFTITLTRQ